MTTILDRPKGDRGSAVERFLVLTLTGRLQATPQGLDPSPTALRACRDPVRRYEEDRLAATLPASATAARTFRRPNATESYRRSSYE